MKKILIITLLFASFQCYGQKTKKIDSFLDIKFGTRYAEVSQKLKDKGGIIESESATKHDVILYKGLIFNKRKTGYTFIMFYDDKAYSAGFVFTPEENTQLTDLNDSIIQGIAETYGPSIKTFKKFNSPYEEGDGNELEALNSGNGEYTTYWIDGLNRITVTTHKGEVVVLITDGNTEQIAKANKKENSDQ